MGDRRDRYEAIDDVWEMLRLILDERKRREFDPTLALLRDLAAEAGESGETDDHTHRRLTNMLGFLESIDAWYAQIRRLPTGSVVKFIQLGDKMRKLLGI